MSWPSAGERARFATDTDAREGTTAEMPPDQWPKSERQAGCAHTVAGFPVGGFPVGGAGCVSVGVRLAVLF
jgi:hypothetical protein